jgi:probable HAF family extracellular repeat protein
MQELGALDGGSSRAEGVSADGRVVVGEAYSAAGWWRAFRWTEATGLQDIGTLPGFVGSSAYGVSADGAVVVGYALSRTGQLRAFRWTASDGMQDLGTLGGVYSWAYAVSADGTIVVGQAETATRRFHAFRWTVAGMEDLNLTYASLLTPGSVLTLPTAISPDGRYIAGVGYNATTGRLEAFLLDTIPEPASLLALGMGLIGLLARRRNA